MKDFENSVVPQVQESVSETITEALSFFYQDDDDNCTIEGKLNEYAETYTKIMHNLFEEFERYSNITF